jgi:3'-phosphoadenosine 5'-phosphosulfate sulfotransferase (PAPS reductase)/FAD synthetase
MAIQGYADDPVSFGGGVNSVALVILLVNGGWRGPIVFADTGAEWPETYEYLGYFQENFLRHYGLEITRLGKEWRTDKSAREMDLLEYCRERKTFPNANRRWCTSAWKVRPLEKWCRAHGRCFQDLLVGISADEARRKPQRRRPLVDHGYTRQDCVDVIAAQGLAVPRKSGCWFCPFQKISQWRELYFTHRDLFMQAVELEEARSERLGRPAFLRKSMGQSLRELAARFEMELSLWPQ